jgi:hypothetical protein
MRQHYIALDKVAITDRVMAKIQSQSQGEVRESRFLKGSRNKEIACGTRRKCFLRKECGKQDLNLHGIATTRPST